MKRLLVKILLVCGVVLTVEALFVQAVGLGNNDKQNDKIISADSKDQKGMTSVKVNTRKNKNGTGGQNGTYIVNDLKEKDKRDTSITLKDPNTK